jgi:hypothetical protein
MKKIIVAAFVLSAMTGYQAAACDWEREAANAPAAVADCSGSNCATEQTTGALKPAEPAQQKIADEPANEAPTTLAACTGSAC